jgi:endonuclease/exonuclease/phosphatase (EEP) superfamily protein YafD
MVGIDLVLWVAASGLLLATFGGFLSGRWWAFDMLAHVRVQAALLSGALTVAALIAGNIGVAGVACIVALFNTLFVLPQLPGRQRPLAAKGGTLRVLFANVLEKNHQYERLVRVIERADPDVIVLAEVDADALAHVRLHLPDYPYCHERTIGPRPLGMGLLSRVPSTSARLVTIDESSAPLVIARFEWDRRPVTIIGAHPLPPYRATWYRRRNRYLDELVDVVSREEGEVVLVGDFNITPWSEHFRAFLRRSSLRDSRGGFGLQTTWPAFLPPLLRIPIDHCFVSIGIDVRSRCVLESTGSDHLPIVVDVSFA